MANTVSKEEDQFVCTTILSATAAFDVRLNNDLYAHTIADVKQGRSNMLITRDIDPERTGEFFTKFMSLCDEFAEKDETK